MKILIAEDDIVSRLVLASTLKKLGHEVVAVENGLKALEAFQKEDFPVSAVAVFIADVMGHGVRAGLITTMISALVEKFSASAAIGTRCTEGRKVTNSICRSFAAYEPTKCRFPDIRVPARFIIDRFVRDTVLPVWLSIPVTSLNGSCYSIDTQN